MRKKILLVGALLCVSAVAFGEGLDLEKANLKHSDFNPEYVAANIKARVAADSNSTGAWNRASLAFADDYNDALHTNGLLGEADRLSAEVPNGNGDDKITAKAFSNVAKVFVEGLKLTGATQPAVEKENSRNARIFENRLLINELDEKVSEGLEETMDIVTDLIADESNKIDENATAIEFLEEKVDVNFDVLSDETIRNERNIARNTQDIKDLRKDHNRGMAQMAAMASVDFGNVKARTVKVGAAVGQHSSETAVAVGVAVAPTDALMVNAKWSTSANSIKKSTLGLGATYEFNF